MGIEKIGGYSGLYTDYKPQNIRLTDAQEIKAQEASQVKKSTEDEIPVRASGTDTTQQLQERSRITDLEDVSLKFNKSEDFGYIGKDASLSKLDMEKAISDMHKDQVLHQYQYFVGSTKDMQGSLADGMVIQK